MAPRQSIIQLRLSTRAAERLEAYMAGGKRKREEEQGGLTAVMDESGGLAAVVVDGERFPVEGGRERSPWMQVVIAHQPPPAAGRPSSKGKGRGGKKGQQPQGKEEGVLLRMEEVGWVHAKASVRVTAAERSSAGLLPTPPLPPTLMTQDNDVLSPSEAEEEQGAKEKGEKKKRKLKTIGLGGAASVGGRRGGLLPAPSVGSLSEGGSVVAGGGTRPLTTTTGATKPHGGLPKALGLGGRRQQVNTTKTEVWVAARVATLEVTGKEIREGLLRGIGLFHDDPVRWLPTKEALEGEGDACVCTLLIRFEKAEHAAVALLRDGEAVQVGGGQGLMSVRLSPCSRTMLEEVSGFGLVLTGHKTVAELLASIQRALPAPVFTKLRTTWARLVPSLRQGVPPPGNTTDPEAYFSMLHAQFLQPLDHAALLLAATKQHTPQASKFVAPENRPPPLDADLALSALTTVRRGLQRWLSRIRATTLVGKSGVVPLGGMLFPPPPLSPPPAVVMVVKEETEGEMETGGKKEEEADKGKKKERGKEKEKEEEEAGNASDDSWDLDLG